MKLKVSGTLSSIVTSTIVAFTLSALSSTLTSKAHIIPSPDGQPSPISEGLFFKVNRPSLDVSSILVPFTFTFLRFVSAALTDTLISSSDLVTLNEGLKPTDVKFGFLSSIVNVFESLKARFPAASTAVTLTG